MKNLLIIILTALLSHAAAAQNAYTTTKDESTGSVVFKGPVTLADLRGEPSFSWLPRGEASYKPDSNEIKYLRTELKPYTIVVVMGTWCDDSQNLVPKLARTLQAAGFPMQQLVMYGVDRSKQTGGIESQQFDIKKVPTIMLYQGNFEAGRIVESVNESIEADLARIIRKHSGRG